MRRLLFLAIAVLALAGCAETFATTQMTQNGTQVTFAKIKDATGHDISAIMFQPPAYKTKVPVQVQVPPQVRYYEKTKQYTKSCTSWQGCSSKKPNRNAKNIKRSEVQEQWTEQVPYYTEPTTTTVMQEITVVPDAIAIGGGSPGIIKAVLPSAFIAGGLVGAASVLRPSDTSVFSSSSAIVKPVPKPPKPPYPKY